MAAAFSSGKRSGYSYGTVRPLRDVIRTADGNDITKSRAHAPFGLKEILAF